MAVLLAIGVLPLCAGVVSFQRRQADSRAGAALDRALSARAAEQAVTLESYFERARTIDLVSVQNPAFSEFSVLRGPLGAKIAAGGHKLGEANGALAYLEQLYPGSIGEACFVDRSGREIARAVRGRSTPVGGLSLDESRNPFFAPTFALRPGQVYQAKPYVSPDTGEWVVSNSTLLPTTDGSKPGFVHFEVTIESFRRAAAHHQRFGVSVIDAGTGAIVFNSRVPQRKGAPLGRPHDRRLASVVTQSAHSGVLDIAGHRSAYQRLVPSVGNANDWYVVATSPPVAAPSFTFNLLPFAVIAAVLLLFAFALGRRWVRIHDGIDEERRQSEEELREREERYRELFENATDLIATTDIDGKITDANHAFTTSVGYQLDELIGKPIVELVPTEWHDELTRAQVDKISAEHDATTYEHELIAKDGHRIRVEVASRLVKREGQAVGIEAICRDISERKQLEEQLRQSQRLEAVGQLAGGIAHDFNNLLTVIIGYTETLRNRNGNVGQAELAQIADAANRAAALTRQLLAFSRRQVLQPEVIDLNEIVSGLSPMLTRLIGEHVQLVVCLDDHLDPVLADPGQIEQVLMNLVINARDAMPDGGQLTIETTTTTLDQTYAETHQDASPGPHTMLAVTDTGSGMDADTLKRVFEPFFTTKAPDKGTGLGLATVHGIVKQSGGNIWAYSEPEQGTTFKVYLPAVKAELTREREVERETSPGGVETILVVEDQDAVRDIVALMLESNGYAVRVAAFPADALRVVEQEETHIDLLLTDLVMPGLSGRELATQIRQHRPEIRVLYMSGYPDHAATRNGRLDPGVPYLEKPFSEKQLAQAIRATLDDLPTYN
jgi:two-component system cell cycle sensor histidine kinase/response regulator CckA